MKRALVLLLLGGCAHGSDGGVSLLPPFEPSEELRDDAPPPSADPTVDPGPLPIERDDPVIGDRLAPATLMVFSDLQCPYCADFHQAVAAVYRRHPHELRVVWKHSPLPFHAHAERAAELAVAVRLAHGERAFWRFVGEAFHTIPPGRGSGDDVLRALGLDDHRVRSAFEGSRPQTKVGADLNMARRAGVSGTPGSFLNGWPIRGAVDEATLEAMVARAIDEAKSAMAGGVRAEELYPTLSQQNFERAKKSRE